MQSDQTVLNVIRKAGRTPLVGLTDDALTAAALKTDLTSSESFYALQGMSGKKYRYFINRLIGSLPDARYLEVGCWMGSTMCSAIHGNRVKAIGIDNWSEFGGPKNACLHNIGAFKTPDANVLLVEGDFRLTNYSKLPSHNVYLFDGPHEAIDQYDGLAMPLRCLDDYFVFIVDDWNWDRVRAGTLEAITKCDLTILYAAEIRTSLDGTSPAIVGKTSDWHNGYFISVLAKPQA